MRADRLREAERELTRIWSEVLERPAEHIGTEDNFFAIGGDSLLVARVMDRVNARFFADLPDEELSIAQFFTHGTIAQLARRLVDDVAGDAVSAAVAGEGHVTIAIIGMAARMPGASDLEAFWRVVHDGRETLRYPSDAELLAAGVDATDLKDPRYVKCAALLDDVRLFDAAHFGLNAREAAITSPEQRLLLECAHEALEHAGYGVRRRGERVGVFVGSGVSTYLLDHVVGQPRALESAAGMQLMAANTHPAARVSYLLDLHGPSITIDTACSSSLVAVHEAVRALASGECDMALAGGATVRRFGPRGYFAEEGGIFSPDGHCRPFDEDARGTVPSSGAGLVLLKRSEAARADRDTIHAVIRGTAVNNDGKAKVGYTAPSGAGQAAVLRSAYAAARTSPASVQYVETHGTATPLGDAIELAALNEVFGSAAAATGGCALGFVKANIGHLEAAAGIAGLIKTALALRHRKIPPTIQSRGPGAQFALTKTPFYLNSHLTDWPESAAPARAGVSSFGIGGTNAHVVLEEPPRNSAVSDARTPQLLIVSARTATAFRVACRNLAAHFTDPAKDLADAAYTLQVGRVAHSFRGFAVCANAGEASDALMERASAQDIRASFPGPDAPIVFLFPEWRSMPAAWVLGLYDSEPVFRACMDRCARVLSSRGPFDLRAALSDGDGQQASDALLFATEYSLGELWKAWGVTPSLVMGDGLGRYVAACSSGVLSLEDAFAQIGALPRAVEFSVAIQSVLQSPAKIFLEVGFGTALSSRLKEMPGGADHAVVDCAAPRRGERFDRSLLLNAVGRLWQAGAAIDWHAFNANGTCGRVPLPTYPFERQRHWLEPEIPAEPRKSTGVERVPLAKWFYVPVWKQKPALAPETSAASECCLLFAHANPLGEALAQALKRASRNVICIRPGREQHGVADGQVLDPMDPTACSRLLEGIEARGLKPDLIVHAWQSTAGPVNADRSIEADLANGFYSVLHLCQALEHRGYRHPLHLVLLTQAAHAVIGNDLRSPTSAMLTAVAPVIAREFPNVRCRAVDVELPSRPEEQLASLPNALLTELAEAATESVIAHRGTSRWVRAHERLEPIARSGRNPLLRERGVYFITGGLGGIGLTLAQFLAKTVQARLILVGRSPLPERSDWERWLATHGETDRTSAIIRQLRELERLGTEVLALQADITEEAQVRDAVAQGHARFGAINGVIHAAGVAGGGIVSLKSQSIARDVIAPKVIGTSLVYDAVRHLNPDFFVLCSSIAAVLTPAGQYDYVAGNAFQDAFAHTQDGGTATKFIAINWDAWKNVGMAVNSLGGELAEGMSCEEGAEVFDLVLRNVRPQWVISTRELQAALNEPTGTLPLAHSSVGAKERSNGESRSQPADTVQRTLSDIWYELLGAAPTSADDDFFELGGDSLLAVQLRTQIESRLGRSVSMRQLLSTSTIAGMTKLLGAAPGAQ